MTNDQILVAAIPTTLIVAMIGFMWSSMNAKFESVNQRFDDMRDLWRAELRRVEEVLDARLKHLEQRVK